MSIDPCDKCKKVEYCSRYKFIKNNREKMGPWEMDEIIRLQPGFASIISASPSSGKIKLDCMAYDPVKQAEDYSRLVGQKPQGLEEVCSCPSTKSCKTGGSGCGNCSC